MKYVRSEDPKARRIGIIAWVLIIVATFVTIWLTYYFTQVAIKSAQDSLTADMGGYLQ